MSTRKRFNLDIENGVSKRSRVEPTVQPMTTDQVERLFIFRKEPKNKWKSSVFSSNKWYDSIINSTLREGVDVLIVVPCCLPDPEEEADLNFLDSVNCWVCSARLCQSVVLVTPILPLDEDEYSTCFTSASIYSANYPSGARIPVLKSRSSMWKIIFPTEPAGDNTSSATGQPFVSLQHSAATIGQTLGELRVARSSDALQPQVSTMVPPGRDVASEFPGESDSESEKDTCKFEGFRYLKFR